MAGIRHVLLVFFGALIGGAVGVSTIIWAITKGGSRKPDESASAFYLRARRAMFIPSLMIIIPLAIIFFAIMALW